MVLCDSQDDDDEAAQEEEEGTDAHRAYREPCPDVCEDARESSSRPRVKGFRHTRIPLPEDDRLHVRDGEQDARGGRESPMECWMQKVLVRSSSALCHGHFRNS